MKHYLVTGGAGYIGSHLVHALLDAGHRVTVFDDFSTGKRENVDSRAQVIEGSVLNEEALERAMHGVDAVMHLAAKLLVEESVQQPAMYYHTNVVGSLNVLRAMQQAHVEEMIFSSTAVVYDADAAQPLVEGAPKKPLTPYGWSKYMVEQMIADIAAVSRIRFVVLRYFNVAGAESWYSADHTQDTHIVPAILDVVHGKRKELSVFGTDYDTRDGTCIRDYVHVIDIAQAHIHALRYLENGGKSDVFNIGTSTGVSVLEMIAAAEEALNTTIPYSIAPRRVGDPPVLIADVQKAKRLLDWQAKKSVIDIFS